jgi:hypothetical protein
VPNHGGQGSSGLFRATHLATARVSISGRPLLPRQGKPDTFKIRVLPDNGPDGAAHVRLKSFLVERPAYRPINGFLKPGWRSHRKVKLVHKNVLGHSPSY